jgi:hypothetical protein
MSKNYSNQVDIEKAIVETMAFFNIFNYPLTSFEVWQYLRKDVDYKVLLEGLKELLNKNTINTKDGFYFFCNKEYLVELRKKRYFYTKRKIKIVKKWFKFFNLFIKCRAIYIANIIGSNNLKNNGDIDLFIVTKYKKLWSTRFFLAFLGKVFGIRPKPGKEKDKLCFSFFIDESNLNLKDFRIDNDLYFIYWLIGLNPLGEKDKDYFFKILKNNLWLKESLPNYFKIIDPGKLGNKREIINGDIYNDKLCFGSKKNNKNLKLNFLQKIIKKIQLKIFPKYIINNANKNKNIIINDRVLKLHVTDRRKLFYEEYLKIIEKYENEN